MISIKKLLLLAGCVRAAYLAGNLLLARLIMDYDTSATLLSNSCDPNWPEAVAKAQQLHPWVVWDSVFMHRIATCGYEFEQFFAFFPAFPGFVRMVQSTGLIFGSLSFTLAALVINNGLFLLSVVLLAKLSEKFLQDDRLALTSVLFFITSPASIHHTMMYTEALFTASSWLGLYCLYCQGSSLTASLAFAVSAGTRSNGLLNAGFLLHEHGRRFLKAWPHSKAAAGWQALQAAIFSAITVAPYFAYMAFGYQQFCTGVYSGDQQRPWCHKTLPSAYGFVQDVYWNVGFLKYYEWNQIPNFLLAAPTLIMSLWGALAYALANPHAFITGGLLTQKQLNHVFGSARSRSHLNNHGLQQTGTCDKQHNGCAGDSRGEVWDGCSICPLVLVGYQHASGDKQRDSDSRSPGGTLAAETESTHSVDANQLPTTLQRSDLKIPGVAYQSLRQRQAEVEHLHKAGNSNSPGAILQGKQQLQQGGQEQQLQVDSTASSTSCSCASGRSFYSPDVAVFVIHWLFLTLVCLAVVHIQVSTRFLSSCVPLYWFAALLMHHKGGLLRWLLWWYCFGFMGVGAVFFTNFYPWT